MTLPLKLDALMRDELLQLLSVCKRPGLPCDKCIIGGSQLYCGDTASTNAVEKIRLLINQALGIYMQYYRIKDCFCLMDAQESAYYWYVRVFWPLRVDWLNQQLSVKEIKSVQMNMANFCLQTFRGKVDSCFIMKHNRWLLDKCQRLMATPHNNHWLAIINLKLTAPAICMFNMMVIVSVLKLSIKCYMPQLEQQVASVLPQISRSIIHKIMFGMYNRCCFKIYSKNGEIVTLINKMPFPPDCKRTSKISIFVITSFLQFIIAEHNKLQMLQLYKICAMMQRYVCQVIQAMWNCPWLWPVWKLLMVGFIYQHYYILVWATWYKLKLAKRHKKMRQKLIRLMKWSLTNCIDNYQNFLDKIGKCYLDERCLGFRFDVLMNDLKQELYAIKSCGKHSFIGTRSKIWYYSKMPLNNTKKFKLWMNFLINNFDNPKRKHTAAISYAARTIYLQNSPRYCCGKHTIKQEIGGVRVLSAYWLKEDENHWFCSSQCRVNSRGQPTYCN